MVPIKIVEEGTDSDLDKLSSPQIRVDMKDSNINLENKSGATIENKSVARNEEGSFYDELFFCYNCKSIFVSGVALKEHQEKEH